MQLEILKGITMKRLIIASALVAALATPVLAGTVDKAKDAITDADVFMADVFENSTLNYIASLQWLVDYGAWLDGLGGVPSDMPNGSDDR